MAGSGGRWGSLRTIRFRITALAALAVAIVLVATAFGLVAVQRRQLISAIDARLEQRAGDLAALVTANDPATLPESDSDSFAQLVDASDRVIAATSNLAGLPRLPIVLESTRDATLESRDDLPLDDDLFRVFSRRIEAVSGPATLHVGASLDEVTDSVGILAVSLASAIPVVVALLAVLVWLLVGRTLAPVETMRAEVDAIGGGDVRKRLVQPPGDDEISRLATTMNQMLERLEKTQARLQRFVADASHELRSPLTRMRAELEVDELHAEEADLRATHRSVLGDVLDLQRLVEDLLHLAQSDAATLVTHFDDVDLDDIVLREVERLRPATAKTIDISGVSAGHVTGDAQQLARVVRNLMDNADRHATSTVTVSVQETETSTVLRVADDGPGIPPEARRRIFERFSRLDDARSRDAGGTGLGLAITRDIVARHHGSISVGSADADGAEIVVELPRGR